MGYCNRYVRQVGQENFKSVTRSFYKGIAAVLLVYAIDGYESFEQLENWMKEVNDNAHKETIIWLIGTKLDLEERRKVSKNKIEVYSKKVKAVGCMEVSAKTGENVKEVDSVIIGFSCLRRQGRVCIKSTILIVSLRSQCNRLMIFIRNRKVFN